MFRSSIGTRVAFVLMVLLRPDAAVAEADAKSEVFKGTRTLSFDSGYVPALTSNRAFWQFGIEFEGAGSLIFDKLDRFGLGASVLTRAGLLLGTYYFWPRVQEAYFVANHELGHGSRFVAMGLKPYYVWRSTGTSHRNIFSFFLQGLGTGGAAYAGADAGNLAVTAPDNWSASIIAAGMNNSAMFAEALEDHVLMGDAHIMEYTAYSFAKEDAASYVRNSRNGTTGGTTESNDVKNVLTHYSDRGFNITDSNIEAGSSLSRWLSSTHWAYVIGAIRYVVGGDPTVPKPVFGALKLPDFSHYLMYEGLSLKVRTAIVGATAQFPLEVEYVYKGDAVVEISAGYRGLRELGRGRKGVNSLQLYANSKAAFGAKAQRDYPFGERLVGTLGASVYQSTLLEGQRNIARFASTGLGYEGWGRLSWVY